MLERMNFLDRIAGMAKQYGPEACWPWPGCCNRLGYGKVKVNLGNGWKRHPAHRASYHFLKRPIPDGLFLDHLCRNARCVNPDHLEPVSPRMNSLRGFSTSAKNARKTHCPQGHPYSYDNTLRGAGGARYCRECGRVRAAIRRGASDTSPKYKPIPRSRLARSG